MVKSNASAMPKRRKVQIDPQLLKELEGLERRMRETDREVAVLLERANEIQKRLREIYAGR